MSLQGVRYHLEQDDTAGQDIDLHIDLEAEDNAEAWEGIGISEEDVEGSITDLKQVVLDVSVEVAAGTDTCYRRWVVTLYVPIISLHEKRLQIHATF